MKQLNESPVISDRSKTLLKGCLLLKKGIEKHADKKILKDFTLKLFSDGIQHHMKTQEKILYPYLDQLRLPYKNMIVRDHETIRLLAERVRVHDNGYSNFKAFVNVLEQHIRFEDKVIYHKVEENLSESDRRSLEQSLSQVNTNSYSDYPVKFWE